MAKLAALNNPSLLALGRVLASALSLASAPVVARAIGPDGRGVTAAAIAAMAIAPIVLSFGIPLEVRRQAASGSGDEALRTARLVASIAFLPSLALATGLSLTLFRSLEQSATIAIFIGLLLTPLSISWICDTAVLISLHRYIKVFILQVSSPAIYLLIVASFWIGGTASVTLVLAASIAGNVVTFLLGMFMVRVSVRGPSLPFSQFMRSGFRYLGSAIADVATNRLDQLIMLPLVGAYQAGLYSVAATIGLAPIAIGQAVAASVYPEMARSSTAERVQIAARGIRAATLPSLTSAALIVVLAPFAIPLIFGLQFSSAILVLQIVGVGTFSAILAYVASMLLAAEGRAIVMTLCQVAGLAVGMIGLFMLGPQFGAVGAAVASTLSYTALSLLTILCLRLPVSALIITQKDFRVTVETLFRVRP